MSTVSVPSRAPRPPTPFGEYVVKHGLALDRLAAALGVTRSCVAMLVSGAARPSAKRMHQIEVYTRANCPDPFTMQAWYVDAS